VPGDALIDDVLEKLPAAMASFEGGAFDDVLYVLLEESQIFFCLGDLCKFDVMRVALS
jgi:hypothetical protein